MIKITYTDESGTKIGEDQLSDEEVKALEIAIHSVPDWLGNAIHNRARQCMDKVIEEFSDRQPKKISESERRRIIQEAEVETAVEREDRERRMMEE